MANESMNVSEWMRKMVGGDNGDFIREAVRLMAQKLMELEASEMTGAGYHERSPGSVPSSGVKATWFSLGLSMFCRLPKSKQ